MQCHDIVENSFWNSLSKDSLEINFRNPKVTEAEPKHINNTEFFQV